VDVAIIHKNDVHTTMDIYNVTTYTQLHMPGQNNRQYIIIIFNK
jgi:hypothetical protein